jgi:hypothetical protein
MSTLRVNTIQNTDSITGLTIESGGRVLDPLKPYARASCNAVIGATNRITFTSFTESRGVTIDIANSRFIVPVAGAYVFGYHHLGNSGSGACQVEIRVNGTYSPGTRTQDTNSSNDSFGTQTVRLLNANDFVEFWTTLGATHNNPDYNSMWIFFLG